MKHLITIFALFCAAVGSAQTTRTLEEALSATDAHLPLAAQIPLIEAAQRSALSALRGNYLPQATFTGQATWQTEVTGLPFQFPGVEIPTLDKDQYRFTLELVQPIWDGGQTSGQIAVQEAQSKTELQRVQTERYTAREQTMQLYCAALLAQKQIEAVGATRSDLRTRKTRLEEQVVNGTAIQANVEAFEVRLLELEQQEEEALARKMSALDGLTLLSGLAFDAGTLLSVPAPAAAPTPTNERPELLLFSLQQQATRSQQQLSTARLMPRLNAIATLGYARPGLNFLSNDFSPYGIFGLNLRWNLHALYSGVVQKEKQQLRIQSDRLELQKQQFLLQNDLRSQQQQREIERLQKVLERDQNIIRLRESIVGTAGVQLDNGVITPSDYLIESTQVTNARLNASIHEIQWIQAQLQRAFIQGKL